MNSRPRKPGSVIDMTPQSIESCEAGELLDILVAQHCMGLGEPILAVRRLWNDPRVIAHAGSDRIYVRLGSELANALPLDTIQMVFTVFPLKEYPPAPYTVDHLFESVTDGMPVSQAPAYSSVQSAAELVVAHLSSMGAKVTTAIDKSDTEGCYRVTVENNGNRVRAVSDNWCLAVCRAALLATLN